MKRAFILGNPRSGTSLLRIMLNAHPAIVSPPESGFLHWWFGKYKDWSIENSKSQNDVKQYISDVLTSRKIETWNLKADNLMKIIATKFPKNYGDLVACVYEGYAITQGFQPEVIIDKNNYYIYHLEELNKVWPDAYFIYLIRDGRDVACSYIDIANLSSNSPYKPSLPSTIETIAREWNDNNINIHQFLMNKNKDKCLMLRYEDLITNTSHSLKLITTLFNLNFSENMVRYFDFNDEPISTIDWKKKTMHKPDITNINKYKIKLSLEEIATFNCIAKNGLEIGNYI